MEYNFNVIFFPTIQWIGFGIMLLAVVTACIISFRMLKNITSKNFVLWILTAVLLITGMTVNSRTKYVIRDYLENKGYTLVIADPGVFENTYRQVDYKDYWDSMNDATYQLDSVSKVIYMQRSKFY